MKEQLFEKLRGFGQEHLLAFWDQLKPEEQGRLVDQINQVDFDLIADLSGDHQEAQDWSAIAERAEPPQAIRLHDTDSPFAPSQARARGEEALHAGRVGMILVAGGQGTRLGFDHPKGMFPLGPVSGRTLFQILVDRLLAMADHYGASIPLYLMTSPATHEETVRFFDEHDRFGLSSNDFYVFCQGVMPAVDAQTGRLLLAEPGSLFLSPDGHGGMLGAFDRSGCMADAKRRGIELLFYGQVDNPLLQICDALLLGYHRLAESEMTTQVVQKAAALERVGNVAQIDGKTCIIEYSDLPDHVAKRTNPDGALRLWAGNLAVHVFDLAFLARVANSADVLPFHRASKKADFVDPQGRVVSPQTPNAIKFERFIFDLLPAAKNAIVVESVTAESFAPVKNANGAATDTPSTARQAMIQLDAAKLRQAGAEVDEGVAVEINPRWALDADAITEKVAPGLRVSEPTYFS